jgi:hypothetical protein
VRRWLTPYLRERWIAYGGALLVFLLLAWWGPIPATQRFWPSLLLIASLIGGAEALRSVAIKEFPDARRPGTET